MDVSRKKSILWGDPSQGLADLSEIVGLPIKVSVDALRTESWPTTRHAIPEYSKVRKRLEEAIKRLQRLSHLPSLLALKASVISLGALSLFDYAPLPTCEGMVSVKAAIRNALGL